jgi:pimeloyl-ACP methyl ester carboxylesterase
MERLSDRFRLIAPDLYGHGHTPAWSGHRGMRVDDEVDLLEPVFKMADRRFHLIGHSWGGAIAMKAALRHLPRLLSVVLYEPALWSLLIAHDRHSAASLEIAANRSETQCLMDAGDFTAAAEYFIDYWIRAGTWKGMTESRRSAFAAAMGAAGPEWHASFHDTTSLSEFAAIDVPTLLLSGTKSTIPAQSIASLLSGVMPHARLLRLEGVGHMGPVTHSDVVNTAIEDFLVGFPPLRFRRLEDIIGG